jgi:SAM-dependent methyltransferase
VLDPTKRFSKRVENYLKYRPGYPQEIIPLLERECGLTAESVVADLGSGTGLLTELFLKHGNRVYGVEPNLEMRRAGERVLEKYPNFTSIDARAEETTLPDHSIDLVVAGQAFHWFDRAAAKAEFKRILRAGAWVTLIWNGFRLETSELVRGYQQIVLRHGTDYKEVKREIDGMEVASFFPPGRCHKACFSFKQVFDFEGLKGRLMSASYAPQPADSSFEPMMKDLRDLFESTATNGTVDFDYETEVYYGTLD